MKKMSIALLSTAMLSFSSLVANEPEAKINYTLILECPLSQEFTDVKNCVFKGPRQTEDWNEWKESTLEGLHALIALIESGKVGNAGVQFSVEENSESITPSEEN